MWLTFLEAMQESTRAPCISIRSVYCMYKVAHTVWLLTSRDVQGWKIPARPGP